MTLLRRVVALPQLIIGRRPSISSKDFRKVILRRLSCSPSFRDDGNVTPSCPKNVNTFSTRSHTCGELRSYHVTQVVKLVGWVTFRRQVCDNLFVVLRDIYGSVQIHLPKGHPLYDLLDSVPYESAMEVEGVVRSRPEKDFNPEMATGEVEIHIQSGRVLNKSLQFPFSPTRRAESEEYIRMHHRYLDLRCKDMQTVLKMRSEMSFSMRSHLSQDLGFLEVETPTLFHHSPGGAREFLVPTRAANSFYSLVQSPQQFKQMLMCGGMDRYFQFARCYRDEGGRAQRQPEFTQLDLELSFTSEEAILSLIEGLIVKSWPTSSWPHLPEVSTPFPRMTHKQAMLEYGCDKPDLRFDMKIVDLTTGLQGSAFPPFAKGLSEKSGVLRGFRVPDGSSLLSNKDRSNLTEAVQGENVNLALVRLDNSGKWHSQIHSKVSPEHMLYADQHLGSTANDLLVLVSGQEDHVASTLGSLRLRSRDLLVECGVDLCKKNDFQFLWVHTFPLFEQGPEGLESSHHPFTAPHPEDVHLLDTDPLKVRAQHFDLVLNGVEVGGGSMRIHDSELQRKIIEDILKLDVAPFKHMMKMLSYGCPPHGGIALGFDRYLGILASKPTLRDVIAFPKMSSGKEAMTDAPSEVSTERLDEYFLNVKPVE